MRTVKASEVVNGMRVAAESTTHNVTVRIEGEVCEASTIDNEQVALTFEDGTQRFYPGDHPVTVLAEPEPEWVEGAWYRIGGTVCIRKGRGFYTDAEDDDPRPDVEDVSGLVLGRVLIVDWPGDEWAADLDACNLPGRHLSQYGARDGHDAILRNVADAIRTQGGAR